ncbi:MAG TPA: ferredoxin [Streptosporangiaceae bacterium]|jgi:ferredoxin|nr:ferredoxin [Streptosporangiaceae bacterium]
MRVDADRDVCIGAGNCVLTAPEVFDQAADGLVDVIDPEPAPHLEQSVRDAVVRCPSGAITVGGPGRPGS